MKKCVFCNNLSGWKEIDAESHIKHKYNVALVLHNATGRGRTVDFNTRGIGFKLNYCPECGRRIESVACFTEEGTGRTYTVGVSDVRIIATGEVCRSK